MRSLLINIKLLKNTFKALNHDNYLLFASLRLANNRNKLHKGISLASFNTPSVSSTETIGYKRKAGVDSFPRS